MNWYGLIDEKVSLDDKQSDYCIDYFNKQLIQTKDSLQLILHHGASLYARSSLCKSDRACTYFILITSFVTVHRVQNKQHQYWIHRERLVACVCPLEPIHTHLCSGGRYYLLPSDHNKAGGTLGFITCPKRQFNALTAGVSWRLLNLLSHAWRNPAGERAFFFSLLFCCTVCTWPFICVHLFQPPFKQPYRVSRHCSSQP